LVRITANVINGWKEQPAGNPCGVNTCFLTSNRVLFLDKSVMRGGALLHKD
jgi:hypothetical protein